MGTESNIELSLAEAERLIVLMLAACAPWPLPAESLILDWLALPAVRMPLDRVQKLPVYDMSWPTGVYEGKLWTCNWHRYKPHPAQMFPTVVPGTLLTVCMYQRVTPCPTKGCARILKFGAPMCERCLDQPPEMRVVFFRYAGPADRVQEVQATSYSPAEAHP